MSRSMISVSSFLKEDTNEMGGRVMRMTLNKDTGSAADIYATASSTFLVRRT